MSGGIPWCQVGVRGVPRDQGGHFRGTRGSKAASGGRLEDPRHLSLIAPSSVSNSVKDGGTFCGPQLFTFSSAKSHENCLHFKVAPVINDKKHPKHLVVTGALHVIQ